MPITALVIGTLPVTVASQETMIPRSRLPATVMWNRDARMRPIAMTGQLVVFETVSSLVHAFLADQRWPERLEMPAPC